MFGSSSQRWHLFDLFGHPIYMTPFFLVLIALFSFMGISAQSGGAVQIVENLLVWGPTLFVGILFHELGHAAALKRFGYGPSDIILQGFGGVTINRRRQGAPPKESIIISLAGPFASFLIAFLSLGVYVLLKGTISLEAGSLFGASGLLTRFLLTMGFINVIWAVFNLMPINPLDGGHVVLHALRAKFGRDQRKAVRYTAITSLVALGLLVVVAIPLQILDPFFFLILAGIFGYQNYQMLQATRRQQGPPRGGPGRPPGF